LNSGPFIEPRFGWVLLEARRVPFLPQRGALGLMKLPPGVATGLA
jgi:hypothetical protein